MPEKIQEKIIWILFLLPGWLSFAVIGLMVDVSQIGDMQVVFFSFVLTFVVLASTSFFCLLLERVGIRKIATNGYVGFVALLFIFSLVIGVVTGLAVDKGWFYSMIRSLPFLGSFDKVSKHRPLSFVLSENANRQLDGVVDARPRDRVTFAWVRITLKTGQVLEGYPRLYEGTGESGEIYVSPACTVDGFGERKKADGPGVLIFEREVQTIEFVDTEQSFCYLQWYESGHQLFGEGLERKGLA